MTGSGYELFMRPVRIIAPAILLVAAASILSASDAPALSTCSEADGMACLTSGGGAYAEKECMGGDDCHTCHYSATDVCTALGVDINHYSDIENIGIE